MPVVSHICPSMVWKEFWKNRYGLIRTPGQKEAKKVIERLCLGATGKDAAAPRMVCYGAFGFGSGAFRISASKLPAAKLLPSSGRDRKIFPGIRASTASPKIIFKA